MAPAASRRSTGIYTNGGGVADTAAPLLDGASGGAASPCRFQGTTLVDWMRARDLRTRALSVAGKDRSAILPIGTRRVDAPVRTVDLAPTLAEVLGVAPAQAIDGVVLRQALRQERP